MKQTEHREQVALVNWCSAMAGRYPQLGLIFAIPNGGDRHRVVAAKLRGEGVKRGVPDLLLPVPGIGGGKRWTHGLFIEMKAPDKRKQDGGLKAGALSPDQSWWVHQLTMQGYTVEVCCGFEEGRKAICDYMGIEVPL